MNNVPAELIKGGRQETVEALTTLCRKICVIKQSPQDWMQSLFIPLPEKRNVRQCQNYRAISLINYPSNVMWKVIQNCLTLAAEELPIEEQARFWANRVNKFSTAESSLKSIRSIVRTSIIILSTSRKLLIELWHEGLWNVLQRFDMGKNPCMHHQGTV